VIGSPGKVLGEEHGPEARAVRNTTCFGTNGAREPSTESPERKERSEKGLESVGTREGSGKRKP
jgi:hypothetical protein